MQWIVTDDIYAETWRRLLEFSNIDLTIDEIVRRHGEPLTNSDSNNYRKQAQQARVCVMQAKEYFDAARTSSLFTSANHSYYGAIALASLVMLILGDGKNSLDVLRSDNRNCHHGLNFTTGCNSKNATKGIQLVEQSYVEILSHGHFSNWYKALPPEGSVYAIVQEVCGPISIRNMKAIGGFKTPPLINLSGTKKSLLNILKYLPDLDSDLQRFGISTIRSRTNHEVISQNDGSVTHTWRIHDCRTMDELDSLLDNFLIEPRYSECIGFQGAENRNGGIVTIKFKSSESIGFRWPDSRETLNHNTISYSNTVEMHEIVDLYMVSYQLSMLSRYFPDIWISCMESQCKAAKLIERSIEIILKKIPILTLSMLVGDEIVISTHLEPWKT